MVEKTVSAEKKNLSIANSLSKLIFKCHIPFASNLFFTQPFLTKLYVS